MLLLPAPDVSLEGLPRSSVRIPGSDFGDLESCLCVGSMLASGRGMLGGPGEVVGGILYWGICDKYGGI